MKSECVIPQTGDYCMEQIQAKEMNDITEGRETGVIWENSGLSSDRSQTHNSQRVKCLSANESDVDWEDGFGI